MSRGVEKEVAGEGEILPSGAGSLDLFLLFHLNLMYSAVEEDERATVLERCYWPLLRMAADKGTPVGIEATGITLSLIHEIDPNWVKMFRELCHSGVCELVGSGYAQLIGPLVPAAVNRENLRLGSRVYDELLGGRPRLALVNEQAYSCGLVPLYIEAGYEGIIMERDNAARVHPEWDARWRHLPQRALGPTGETIALIWNESIVFQKFQRYAHGETELPEYLDFVQGHGGPGRRVLSLYGNDAEVFDFRPGRYDTEAPIVATGEWDRIQRLVDELKPRAGVRFALPGDTLALLANQDAGNSIRLEAPEQPIPVKKQRKYNITRWGVSGRDDIGINTACWRAYEDLRSGGGSDEEWQELCYLWSSDFRTHITDRRWSGFTERLEAFAASLQDRPIAPPAETGPRAGESAPFQIKREGQFLEVTGRRIRVRLNCRRGLAVDGAWFGDLEGGPVIGTLPHGYYDDIHLGADWYTGHLVFERLGLPKLTDLEPVEPEVDTGAGGHIVVSGSVSTPLGLIRKRVVVEGGESPAIGIRYVVDWESVPRGSLRLGYVTLNPERFDRSSLVYRTHNGGAQPESYSLGAESFDHGESASSLVSASGGLGLTEGWVEMGDERQSVRLTVDRRFAAAIGLMTFRPSEPSFFWRTAFSVMEVDETLGDPRPGGAIPALQIRITWRGHGHG